MSHNIIRDLYYSLFPDSTKYLTYREGKLPIILSAPHGGNIKPTDIPYRKYGNRSRDTYTRRLIQKIISNLDDKPFYIYADIHRSRVDLNRDIKEAAQGNKKAENVWNTWNKVLDAYVSVATNIYGKGLYIDIHSHNNSNRFQIGYGLSVKDYLAIRSARPINARSTMYDLRLGNSEFRTLFGNRSFPHLLINSGYEVLVPEKEENYLNGGRNIQKFSGNGIGAIQIECPISVLKYDLNRVAFTISNSIKLFQDSYL